MAELLVDALWPRLRAESKSSQRRRFAIAYLGDHEALHLARGDIVVVDASNSAIEFGKTSAHAVASLFNKGVNLFSLPNLHAKLYVFDNCVVVGSSNLSKRSQTVLHEAGLLSTDEALVQQATDEVLKFAAHGSAIDIAFIERIKNIKVVRGEPNDAPPCVFEERAPDFQPSLYRLAVSPSGDLLRAYFVAFIELQLGELKANSPFRLWGGNYRTHLKSGALIKQGNNFILSAAGARAFAQGCGAPKPELLMAFKTALSSGRDSDLPPRLKDTRLIAM